MMNLTDLELPKELEAELRFSKAEISRIRILQIIKDLGGSANLNDILIELYKRHGVIEKRAILTSKLHYMKAKGRVYSMKRRYYIKKESK